MAAIVVVISNNLGLHKNPRLLSGDFFNSILNGDIGEITFLLKPLLTIC